MTAEQVVALVKADMAEREKALETRRAKDAERQRRQRSRGVTRSHADNDGLSPLKVSPTPPSSNPPISPVVSSETTPPADPPTLVLEAYNLMAAEAGLPKARMTPERRKKLRTFTARHKVEDITEAIWAIPRTPFLCGENPRGWKADFDFLLQPKSFTRILEGSYGG
jgi:hypothetical protein